MTDDELQLNVALLKRRVPNLTSAAKSAGLRPATVSNLCTGKIPVGRAEVRTLATLASLAGCSLDELIIRGGGAGMIETGIKVLDLFAPLVRGGTAGIVARPGMGQLVMLAELFRRLKRRGFATVFWKPREKADGIDEAAEEAETAVTTIDDACAAIGRMREDRDVLLGADRSMVLSGELQLLRERLQEAGARPLTIILVDCRGEAADEEVPYGPLDTLWRFAYDLAARRLYPAVDPVYSTSTILEGAHLEAAHSTVQQRARKLLRRYRELRSLVEGGGKDWLAEPDVRLIARGERLEAFLSQPFYTAEPFTGKEGSWLTLAETLEDVRRILDGSADDSAVGDLFFTGRFLPDGNRENGNG